MTSMNLLLRWRIGRTVSRCCAWGWHAETVDAFLARERQLDTWVCRANQQHAQDVADECWARISRELREKGE